MDRLHMARVTSWLMFAAASSDVSVLDVLLRAGADPNAKNNWGTTALMLAAVDGDGAMARRLLAAGADASLKDADGNDAARLAQRQGHSMLAELLRRRRRSVVPLGNASARGIG